MNVQTQNVRDIAISTFKEVYDKGHGDKMKARIKAVNDACEVIVDNRGIPNAKNVTEWIVSKRPAAHLPEQTIYNKRSGEISPYLKIIQAWAAVAASMSTTKSTANKKVTVSGRSTDLVTNDDLIIIPDLIVRHKVALLIGQFNGLRNQSEMRQAIKNNPPVPGILSVTKLNDAIDHNMALSSEEIEALADFLSPAGLNRRGIEFDDVGAVIVKRAQQGSRLSKPGFVDAIKKILGSYGSGLLE